MSTTRLDLPLPLTPVTQVKVASGKAAVMFRRLLARAPVTVTVLARALAAGRAERDLAAAGEVIRGEAALAGEEVVEGSGAHHLAAVDAGARAHVDHMVGGADRLLVMLDHQHGVAEAPEALERLEQAVVVLLVEADRGLVEDVEHARQAAADLARRGGCAGSRRRLACRCVRSRWR